MPSLRFRVHAILQMEERGLTVDDIRMALGNGEDIESRPDDAPYPAPSCWGPAGWASSTWRFVTTSTAMRS